MLMCNYVDAEVLDDNEKGKYLTSQERKYAAYVRELPSFTNWFVYNMFTPFSFCGDSLEYGIVDDFMNMRGDITKISRSSTIQ